MKKKVLTDLNKILKLPITTIYSKYDTLTNQIGEKVVQAHSPSFNCMKRGSLEELQREALM